MPKRFLVGVPVILAAVALTTYLFLLHSSTAQLDLWGARLGDGAADVRTRFAPGSEGDWTSTMGPEGVLSWVPRAPEKAEVLRARFEFHDSLLVAIRVKARADASWARGPASQITPAALLVRIPHADGTVDLTELSRSCPTHAAEVTRWMEETH